MDQVRLLDGLDPAQRHAVTTPSQPLAILAGAGSGKTRVLTRRIAYRCAIGDADARHVLAVTFTRKAAAELDRRLRSFGLRDLPAAGTFHALAYAQLRTAWAADGQAAPTLLDRKGRLLARVLGGTRRVTPSDLATEIEWAKARLVGPATYVDAAHRAGRVTAASPERVAGWYERYEAEKRSRGLVDFDDLLIRCAALIERDPSFAAAQRWRFRHLFVDEYQDVNPLQERLLRAWAGDRDDLCVVGDLNQAIYSWNGADAGYLRDFATTRPGAEVVELRDSYRSTPEILTVAAHVLAAGRTTPRPLIAHRTPGPAPTVTAYADEREEANGIARAVRQHHGPGRPWSAQAVLVRVNAQTAPIEEAFRRSSIPYRVRGGRLFLEDHDVRDLLAGFDRMREPLVTSIADLEANTATIRAELHGPDEARLGDVEDTAAGRRLAAFEHVVRLGRELLAMEPTATTDSFPTWVRSTLRDDGPTGGDAVTIATFHAAKGLEWDVVHLAGLEAGLVPVTRARTPEARAEEQRLLYVAVTRASTVLSLSWARQRSFGSEPIERAPSPFLAWVRDAMVATAGDGRPAPAPTRALTASRAALTETESETVGVPERAEARHRGSALLDHEVAERLRQWRAAQARRAAVLPTVVLSDRALDAIARHRPHDADSLAGLPGIGPVTLSRYGPTLLALVAGRAEGNIAFIGRGEELMRFELTQHFDAPADEVFAAYTSTELYPTLVGLPKLGGIEVLGREVTGDTIRLRVHFRFTGHLPAAVTAVVHPERLTWVQESEHDPATSSARFRLLPDHYPDRLAARGSFTVRAHDGGSRRVLTGELKVKALLVAGQVERAIVSGLDEYLQAEAPAVDRWLAGR